MKRGRQPPRRRTAATVAVGADEPERAVATQGMLESCAAAEIEEVGAASHGNVLTGVDEPTRDGIVERCGPAAGTPPALEDRHREPRIEEPSRCGQASEPTPHDDDSRFLRDRQLRDSVHRSPRVPQNSVATAAASSRGREGRTRFVKMAGPARRTVASIDR